MKPAVLHDDAIAEYRTALDYYSQLRVGLDGEFRKEFENALARIRDNPALYAINDGGVRFCPLHRFPYSLVYADLDDRIWVAAVSHQRRRPRYWSRRRPGDSGSRQTGN
ncbi:MAG: type II toxin-antitoxin system RelE/ParE family toxin [Planctomycetota bacterium]